MSDRDREQLRAILEPMTKEERSTALAELIRLCKYEHQFVVVDLASEIIKELELELELNG